MTFRGAQIYISRETKRHLWIIAKGLGLENSDAAGERLLSETIAERYPALVAHQKQVNDLESTLVESLVMTQTQDSRTKLLGLEEP